MEYLETHQEESIQTDAAVIASEPDFNDADSAMAWLEGLAAKHGVGEEELLTSPEERSELPPDWVQKEAETSKMDKLAEDADAEFGEDTPGELDDVGLEESPVDAEDVLSEGEPGDQEIEFEVEDQPQVPHLTDDIPTEDDLSDDLPAFLREREFDMVSEEVRSTLSDTVDISTDEPDIDDISKEIPDWLRQSIETDEVEEDQDETTESEPTIEEFESLDETDEYVITEDKGLGKGLPTDQTLPVVDVSEDEFEPPTWVLEGKEPEENEYQWLPAETEQPMEEAAITKDPELDSDALDLLDLNQASMIQLERLPSLGFRSAQAIITYRDLNGPFKDTKDLSKVPGLDEITVTALRKEVMVTVPTKDVETQPEIIRLRGSQAVEPVDEFHALQLAAQADFDGGNISGALKKYANLIKKGKRLDDVIKDLNQGLAGDLSNEVCVDILQILGDAHMKADHLQDALDAYTKAEELLR